MEDSQASSVRALDLAAPSHIPSISQQTSHVGSGNLINHSIVSSSGLNFGNLARWDGQQHKKSDPAMLGSASYFRLFAMCLKVRGPSSMVLLTAKQFKRKSKSHMHSVVDPQAPARSNTRFEQPRSRRPAVMLPVRPCFQFAAKLHSVIPQQGLKCVPQAREAVFIGRQSRTESCSCSETFCKRCELTSSFVDTVAITRTDNGRCTARLLQLQQKFD